MDFPGGDPRTLLALRVTDNTEEVRSECIEDIFFSCLKGRKKNV